MNYKTQLHLLSKDIRFWIIFFFLLRMYGITMPPLEVGHNWRQTDGLMIARNFYENNSNIFYPTVDLGGEKSGITGSEFPLLNYLIYLLSLIFGYAHWYGRLIVLIFSSIGSFFFFKIIKKYFNESVAFNATIILMVSMWFSYSRKIIPDVFAVSLCIASLYHALQYLETGKLRSIFIFFLLGLLGCSSKIFAATILTVLLIPVLNRNYSLHRKTILSLFSSLILIAVCYWYFIWVPYLKSISGTPDHFFMGLSFKEGATNIVSNSLAVFERLFTDPLKYIGFLTFLLALFFNVKHKKWVQLVVFLLPFLSFLILLIKTGASIVGDEYYVLTMIPAMAFIMGCGLAEISSRKIAMSALIVIGIESIADQIYDFRIREPFRSLENLEPSMNLVSKSTDLIAVNGETHYPTIMYFAHRRGWSLSSELLLDSIYVNDIRSKGCKYILIAKTISGDIQLDYTKVLESEYFKIYRIE